VNLANALTAARIALTPWIVLRFLAGDCRGALALLAVAAATDAADGYTARRFGQLTRAGAYLDPVADKLLLTAVYISLGIMGVVPGWLVLLIVGRDVLILTMVAAGLAFTEYREFPPSIWGKLSTVVQIATAVTAVMVCAIGYRLHPGFVWATAVTTAWSGMNYVWRGWRMLTSGVSATRPRR
jgi:cardiolipin synthase (CMP-forming)